MLTLRPWAASLIAAIIAAFSCLDGLLLRPCHMAVLAETPEIVRDVRPVREDVIHLIRLVAAEHAKPAVTLKDRAPDLLPVLRELLTAPGLPTPRHLHAHSKSGPEHRSQPAPARGQ